MDNAGGLEVVMHELRYAYDGAKKAFELGGEGIMYMGCAIGVLNHYALDLRKRIDECPQSSDGYGPGCIDISVLGDKVAVA